MATPGGSVESVSLAGRLFTVAADSDGQRSLGGFQNENQMNGDGSSRPIKTRMPWVLGGLALSIDDARGDQEFLQGLADRSDYFAFAVTFVSGRVYQARGQIVDEIAMSTQSVTAPLTFSGPGKLVSQ